MISVDLAAPFAKHDVFRGTAELFGGSSSDANTFGGVTTDGVGIIVFYNGQLFYVKTDHTIVLPALAGVNQPRFEYPDGYDPKAMHTASTLQLPTVGSAGTDGADGFLSIDSNKNVYIVGNSPNNEPFVEKVACH